MKVRVVATVDDKTKILFDYEAQCAPRVGDDLALTIDDEGFLFAEVAGVLHIPLKPPRLAEAQVVISTEDLAVARWAAARKPWNPLDGDSNIVPEEPRVTAEVTNFPTG